MSLPDTDALPGASMIRRAEWAVAITGTAILVGLHLAFLLSAGGLWRDEVAGVNAASFPSLKDTWAHLGYESFPILWFAVLRAWLRIGPGTTDLGIRVLGLLVGLGIAVVLWRNARRLGHSIPLASLVLLGFNSAAVSYGDSIRGHGLGMLTGLLAFGLIWDAADSPTAGRIGLAMLAALMSVHCLYYNTVFVLAACLGGAAVALSRKSWRSAGMIVGIGAACAISLLPYTLTIQSVRGRDDTHRADLDFAGVWQKVQEAFADSGGPILWVWLALTALALAATVWAWTGRVPRNLSDRERAAALYCTVALLAGLPAYVLFLKALGYVTQPWYYVALMALVAACLDAPLSLVARSLVARTTRLAGLVLFMTLVIHPVWTAVRTRRTNVDLIAGKVRGLAVKGDLIVVSPWYLGITFDRYYRGAAEWITIPPMSSLALHRYDLLKEKMMSRAPMTPVLEGMRAALAKGHRVYWVGELFIPKEGEVAAEPPPAPHALWGWADAPYYESWGRQAGDLIKSHAKAGARIEVPLLQPVNAYEDSALFVFSGWWDGERAK